MYNFDPDELAGVLNNRLTDKFGMGKVLTCAAALQMLGCESSSTKSVTGGQDSDAVTDTCQILQMLFALLPLPFLFYPVSTFWLVSFHTFVQDTLHPD
jgi:hypothetical protein